MPAVHSGSVVDLGAGRAARATLTVQADGSVPRVATWLVNIPATAFSSGVPQLLHTPPAGQRARILGWQLGVTGTMILIFVYGAGGVEAFRTAPIILNTINAAPPGWGDGFLFGAPGEDLKLKATGSAGVSGCVFGVDE